ncbi:unnamed protein product, partial [Darwinula stevensoni]
PTLSTLCPTRFDESSVICLISRYPQAANLTDTFPSLTPNAVSTAHVVLAVATSRLLIDNADLRRRQLGVILFALRNVLDVLDGTIARESRRHHRLDTYEGFGYYYDGICDAVGIASLMFACVFYLLKLHGAHGAGASEDAVRLIGLSSPVKEKGEFEWTRNGGGPLTKRRIWVLAVCFGGQIIMSTVGWNTVMTGYHEVLEGEDRTPEQKAMALEVAKSWSMWMIAWCWRLANCNMLFDVVLVAIFLNKAIELFQCFQVIGYLVLGPLILLSEFHLAAVKDSMLGLAPHVQ